MTNFQREGAISNAQIGREFEERARGVLAEHDLDLIFNYTLAVGVASEKKEHAFDLGSEDPKVIVECKAQTWTAGNKVPSAKMKTGLKPCSIFTWRRMIIGRYSSLSGA